MSRTVALIAAILLLAAAPVSAQQPGGDGGDGGAPEDAPNNDRGGQNDTQGDGTSNNGTADNGTAGGGPGDRGAGGNGTGNGSAQSEDKRPSEAGPPASRSERNVTYPHTIKAGEITLILLENELVNLSIGNTTLFASIVVPGLDPVETISQRGDRLTVQGDQARVDLQTRGRLSITVSTSAGGLQGTLAPDVEAHQESDRRVTLSAASVAATVQAEDLLFGEGRFQSGPRLQLVAGNASEPGLPSWARASQQANGTGLPYVYEGRYLAFELSGTGVTNLSVHGVALGDVTTDVTRLDDARSTGARLSLAAGNLSLEALDTPRTLLRIEAPSLIHDLPSRTSLPSGATILVDRTGDVLTLTVEAPRGSVGNETGSQPTPARLAAVGGDAPGLRAESERGALTVTSTDPSQLSTHFQGTLDESQGAVSMNLSMVRALLIKDLDGDGQVDIGEPAVAESRLQGGTTTVEGDEVRSTFALWSGNLTVVSEPGADSVKVTYIVEDLAAPPGTLFVLESQASAPAGMEIRAEPGGVSVTNGSLAATFTTDGPVTVDGEPAWAQRSVLLQPDGTVHILLAYPAGDDLVHDPTVQVQSVGTAVTDLVSATPSAVVVGALAGLILVSTTIMLRRRGPP